MFWNEVGMASNFIDTLFSNGDGRLLIPSGIYVTLLDETVMASSQWSYRKWLWHCFANFCSAALFVGKDLINHLWSIKRHNSLCYSGSSCRETECWWLLQSVRICVCVCVYTHTHTHTLRRKPTCAYLVGFERSWMWLTSKRFPIQNQVEAGFVVLLASVNVELNVSELSSGISSHIRFDVSLILILLLIWWHIILAVSKSVLA